jgi:cytochrome c peroxidase
MAASRTLAAFVVGTILAAPSAKATTPPPRPGPLAEPQSSNQPGFPAQLAQWLLPQDQPESPTMVALGKALFFDPRLSVDDTVACASCHDPEKGFTDQLPTSMGVHASFGKRNAPTVLNAMFNIAQFWDGRRPTLEDQARDPILNPIEMGMPDEPAVVRKLSAIPEYAAGFRDVFGKPPNYDDLVRAIAAYERTQSAFDAPFDRFMAGDDAALTPQQKAGWALFNGKGRCMSCHGWNPTRPLFTDDRFHNIGVSAHKSDFVPLARQALDVLAQGGSPRQIDQLAIQTDLSELGRFLVTKQPHDIGAFRTMGLRNLFVTQPYFHDGSQATIWDTLDHYNKGGVLNPFLDGGIVPLGLSEQEEDDLAAFLLALTSQRYLSRAEEEYARQFKISRTTRPQRDVEAAAGLRGRNGPGFAGPFGDIGPSMNEMAQNPALLGGRAFSGGQ